MADKKVSALSAITNLSTDDLLLVVNDPAGTPESKKVTVGNLFGNVAVTTTHKGVTTFTANTNHTGTTATFSANVIIGGTNIKTEVDGINARVTQNETDFAGTITQITTAILNTSRANTQSLIVSTKSSDPATSNATTEGITAGTIFYSDTYLYVTTDSNTIKRVALSTF